MRPVAAFVWLVAAVSVAGCGTQNVLLDAQEGYLFTAYDAVALPGENVALRARLQGGDFLRDQPGYVVRFRKNGTFYKAAETDSDGFATATFTPEAPGDYVLRADLSPNGFPHEPPAPTSLLVRCRAAETPMLIVDLDKTLVASGFEQVLLGEPEPMPDSPAVMKRLAERYMVVYLTHRPDMFGPKSKMWLREHGYPTGPLLLSDVGGFLKGSGAFKSAVLADLRRRFKGKAVGIGDKVSDAIAYHENGLQAFFILEVAEDAAPDALRRSAQSLEALPEAVQVVTGWNQIEKTVFNGLSFPPSSMRRRLRELADDLDEKQGAGS
ncbi:MAG: hypothetical protein WBD05_01585 [Phycisphaerae bacterium]